MAYPKYFVSYTVMDEDAGANPFHHAFLLLSKQETADSPHKVESAYGFYSRPSKSNWFWKMVGITFKLQNSHGVLKKEAVREIDSIGLTAKHFEAGQEAYNGILTKLADQIKNEQAAIIEHTETLGPNPQPEAIYQAEREKNGENSRLQRFEVRLGYDFHKGLHTRDSYTCKTQSLDTLEEFELLKRAKKTSQSVSYRLSPDEASSSASNEKPSAKNEGDLTATFCSIDSNNFGFAFPRASDEPLSKLFLFSRGPLIMHKSKRTGAVSFYRQWDDKTSLFFALSPELTHGKFADIQKELFALKKCDKRLCKPENEAEIKTLNEAQEELLALYQSYSKITSKTSETDVELLISKSLIFRETYQPAPKEVSASFLFLTWQTTLALTLTASVLALVAALSVLSSGLLLTAVVAATTLSTFASVYGLFSIPSPDEKDGPADKKTPSETLILT